MTQNKKAMTSVIALILLLMMTIAASGAAFFWYVRIQSSLQGGTEAYTEQLTETVSSLVNIVEIDTMVDDSLKIILRNGGNSGVSLGDKQNIVLILSDLNQNVICTQTLDGEINTTDKTFCQDGCSGDLAVKGTQTILLNISNSTNDCYFGGYANNTLFYFELDFGGQTQTGGQFTKAPPY